ncbi:SNF5-domain-containing protein [Panus rudis PR-1116 ss-1]|nr:SNF5-domain-containing protein [Panus rudis PR-1116 ss-1]
MSQPVPPPTGAPPARYLNNIRQWSTSVTPPPTNGRTNPTRKSTRVQRGSSLANSIQPSQPVASTSSVPAMPAVATATPAYLHPATQPVLHTPTRVQTPVKAPPTPLPQPPQQQQPMAAYTQTGPLPTVPQAMISSYSSRVRTGTTLLMQPILTTTSSNPTTTVRTTRRGGVVSYVDPGSGDEFPDAGALDSDDSDFGGGGGGGGGGSRTYRSARLSSRAPAGAGVFRAGSSTPSIIQQQQPVQRPEVQKKATELDRSYLGEIPPPHLITPRYMKESTPHSYFSQYAMESQAWRPAAYVPIRVEFETETHRIRDCFVWNLNEGLIKPEAFARIFCFDLELPENPWVETIANQIKAQLEDYEGVAGMDLGDPYVQYSNSMEEVPECRVILSIDVQIGNYHLVDHIEWDLFSTLTPESFAQTLCADLGLGGEAIPLISHAIHEELIKHKRDAIEWGVIGGDDANDGSSNANVAADGTEKPRDKSGLSLLKDKTGLGLGWGRTPKDGRGPKPLRSVWKDWPEAEEFRTRFEVLSAEEVERREIERERAARRLRRETSKFQSQANTRRRYR